MILTDSIAVYNGQIEGNTYSLFKDNKIFNYKLKDGIEFKELKEKYKIKININTYLINDKNNKNDDNF